MTIQAHRHAAPGELVAVDLPPGEAWLDVLADLWWRGVSVFPMTIALGAGGEGRR